MVIESDHNTLRRKAGYLQRTFKYLLSIYYVPGTIPGVAENGADKTIFPQKLEF